MLKALARFIGALNGNVKKSQIAAGFAWGLLLGLVPAGNVFWIALFLISFWLKHNHWSKILFMVVLMVFSQPLGRLIVDPLGWWVLHIDGLQPLYTKLYNMPFVPFTKFYNTLVAGGLVGGLLLCIPVYFLFFALITLYRNVVVDKLSNSKLGKAIAKSPFFLFLKREILGE
jgi:uncharacterized protein (TIGR03546 family)